MTKTTYNLGRRE